MAVNTSNAAIVARWTPKLAGRQALLVHARAQAAYHRVRKAVAKPHSAAWSHQGSELAAAEKKVAKRKTQVATAVKVLKRHATGKAVSVMYDSVTISEIPSDAQAVAGYTAGNYPTYNSLVAKFPKALHLSIAVASKYDADCLDVEPGDATPELAPGWVKKQQARGVDRPVVYCSVSTADEVIARLKSAGIARNEFRLWTAHYTYHAHTCTSACHNGFSGKADATQWTDKSGGRNLDESKCGPDFWD